ncbi:MAG TPA: NAD(P)/FAD-dependent oxidoreductase [Blastocatellia bacterium]|nr:NAD(P)/FAD-dependent oxidoreductase [Blastocatellia bacterium]
MHDVAIVGARCAGSTTAMLLARKGYRVLLVDKAAFPSDTMSTHFIHVPGVAKLKRWGLLDRVAGSNCPPVRSYSVDLGPFALSGSPPALDDVSMGYGPRRTVLDKILVDAAAEAGAEVREKFTTEELWLEGGSVTGIRGRTENGTSVGERARLVIGADGLHSLVARMAGAAIYNEKPVVACAYYTYWSGVSVEGAELYPRENRFIVAFPTNDGLVCTLIEWPKDYFPVVRADIEGEFFKALELAPGLAARIRNGKRAERFAGTVDLPNFFRKPHGPGWALVGDAGHRKDPNGAHGISDAFRDAELLADAVDGGFSGRQRLEDALAEYERLRNESALPTFELNFQFATLQPPPPEIQTLLGALRGNQVETNRFIGALVGTVPIPEFFAPASMQRILSAADGNS